MFHSWTRVLVGSLLYLVGLVGLYSRESRS